MSSPREQAISLLEQDLNARKKAGMSQIQAQPNLRESLLREFRHHQAAIQVLKAMTDSHWNDYLKRK